VKAKSKSHTALSLYVQYIAAIEGSHCMVAQVQVSTSLINQITVINNVQVIIKQCDSIHSVKSWGKIKVINVIIRNDVIGRYCNKLLTQKNRH